MIAESSRFRSVAVSLLAASLVMVGWVAGAPELTVWSNKNGASYGAGETIEWKVSLAGAGSETLKDGSYILRQGGQGTLAEGKLDFTNGEAVVKASWSGPGSILAEINATASNGQKFKTLAGAVVVPEAIKPSAPCPDDFEAFWKEKLDELAKVPANPVLVSEESAKGGVDYWKITMDNIRGTHIRGQLARPSGTEKRPALLLVQYAGVYGLPKTNVTNMAAEGWLALNISAHDLPIDQAEAFYREQDTGALKNYVAIGNDDREKCYFLRMFLACSRAVDYLAGRPDWDGKTLVVSGTSQGGLQAFVTAGLNPKVTGMLALVPAGCDNSGTLAGRKPGWPYWMNNAKGKDEGKALETSKYFDAVNFAARVRCPALVGLGLIDTTSPPSGVFAAFNQLHGEKEVVVMPFSDHKGRNNTQAPYHARAREWRKAWVEGRSPVK